MTTTNKKQLERLPEPYRTKALQFLHPDFADKEHEDNPDAIYWALCAVDNMEDPAYWHKLHCDLVDGKIVLS